MNKYIIAGMIMTVSAGFASCSDDEEILTPSPDVVDNKFIVPDDATGPEADLRRSFYDKTGTYLVFTDLLSHEYVGNVNGKDVYKDEYIDFTYNMTNTGEHAPVFEFLEDIDSKREAVKLIEEYIYPRLEGGSLMPFSILPVKSLQTWQDIDWEYQYAPANTVSCWRCMAIATADWLALPDDDAKRQYARELLKTIVQSKFSESSDEADPFMELSYEHAGDYISDLEPDWDRSDMSMVYKYGYLTYRESWRGPQSDYFYYSSTDFENYFDAVMDMEMSEFMELYGEYELVVKKYNIIREAIASLGYKF